MATTTNVTNGNFNDAFKQAINAQSAAKALADYMTQGGDVTLINGLVTTSTLIPGAPALPSSAAAAMLSVVNVADKAQKNQPIYLSDLLLITGSFAALTGDLVESFGMMATVAAAPTGVGALGGVGITGVGSAIGLGAMTTVGIATMMQTSGVDVTIWNPQQADSAPTLGQLISQTKQLISGTSDSVTAAVSDAGTPLAQAYQDAMKQLNDAMNDLAERLGTVKENVYGLLEKALDEAAAGYDQFEDWLRQQYDKLGRLLNPIDDSLNYECVDNWCKLNRSGQSYTYDPLALDLDGDGLETVSHNRFSGSLFDHNRDGIRTATGWVAADDGFLVYDRNGNGLIDHGGELFGDSTVLADGSRAAHGYAALAEWDADGNGKVDAADQAFSSLRVWRDLNQDGISQSGELFTLADVGVQALNLAHTTPNTHLGNGNFLAQSGSYIKTDGSTAQMGDLDLAADHLFTRHSEAIELTDEQRQAPNLHGMGRRTANDYCWGSGGKIQVT